MSMGRYACRGPDWLTALCMLTAAAGVMSAAKQANQQIRQKALSATFASTLADTGRAATGAAV